MLENGLANVTGLRCALVRVTLEILSWMAVQT